MDDPQNTRDAAGDAASLAAARGLVKLNLAVIGAAFAWFAYVDASITDAAMAVIAVSVALGFASALLALLSIERVLGAAAAAGSAAGAVPGRARGARARRLALLCFVLSLAGLLTAATVTLNLKGSGSEDDDTQTAMVTPA